MKDILRGLPVCALASLATQVLADDSSNQYTLDIERLPIVAALTEFSRQTGLQVGYLPKNEKEESTIVPPLRGQYTAEVALQQMLAPSGLKFEKVNDRTIAVTASSTCGSVAFCTDGAKKSGSWQRLRLAQAETPANAARENRRTAEPSAASQKNAAALEVVIVTAQKRKESIQDAALSVAVLTEETLERRSMVSMDDFMRSVPGVSLHDRGPGANAITIRGIGADANDATVDPTTGVYLGEIPLAGGGGLFNGRDIKLVDIERVEVLRGPQGTLFGSSSLAGTLRYVANAPDLEKFGGTLNLGYSQTDGNGGDNDEVTGVVNLPLVEDKLALRVAGYYFDNSGYVDAVGEANPARAAYAAAHGASLLVGGDLGAHEYAGGRASLLWKPVESVSATLTYLNQQLDQDGFSEEDASLSPYQDAPLSFRDRTPGGRERRYADTELLNLELEWELDKLDVMSSTSRFDVEAGEARDGSRAFPWALGVLTDTVARSTTQELRVSTKFSGPFNFLAGIYYEDTDFNKFDDTYWFGDDALCCAVNDAPAVWGTDPEDMFNSHLSDSIEQKAFFSELYVDLTDQIKLTLGGRYFDYDRSTTSLYQGGNVGNVDLFDQRSVSTNGTTLKANLGYSPTADSLLYVQWAQGFRLGKPVTPPTASVCDLDSDGILDGTVSTPISVNQLDPDTTDSWELGGKFTLLDGRWTVNTAVYHTRWEKMPSSIFGTGCSATFNAAEARSRGLEVESAFSLAQGLVVNLGASLVDAELTKNAEFLAGREGDPLQNTARFQGSIGLQQQFDIFGHAGFTRADYAYVGPYHSDFAELGPELGAYGKLDMRAGISLGKYEVALFGTNLTNEDALTASETSAGRIWRLRPRTYGIEFRVRTAGTP